VNLRYDLRGLIDDVVSAGLPGRCANDLIRENGGISDHTFEIEFLDPGVQAYAFTFG